MLKEKLLEIWKKNHFPSSAMIVYQDLQEARAQINKFLFNILGDYIKVRPEDNSDITIIELENNKSGDLSKNITIDQIRRLRENFSSTSGISSYKFGIIIGADFLNLNASNALLKILEDTPKNSYLLVVSQNPNNLLRTIQSRLIEIYRHDIQRNHDTKVGKLNDNNSNNFFHEFLNPEFPFQDKSKEIDKFLATTKYSTHEKLTLISESISSFLLNNNPVLDSAVNNLLEFSNQTLSNVRLYNLDLRQAIFLIISKFMLTNLPNKTLT